MTSLADRHYREALKLLAVQLFGAAVPLDPLPDRAVFVLDVEEINARAPWLWAGIITRGDPRETLDSAELWHCACGASSSVRFSTCHACATLSPSWPQYDDETEEETPAR